MYINYFLKAWLLCASIQLTKNFLFTEVKIKLHGFHKVKITYVLFQRRRPSKTVVQRCSSSRSQMFFIISVLKNLAIFIGKHLCWNLFLTKLRTDLLKRKTPTQVFSYEYCEIFKNSFFYRTSPVAASTGAP